MGREKEGEGQEAGVHTKQEPNMFLDSEPAAWSEAAAKTTAPHVLSGSEISSATIAGSGSREGQRDKDKEERAESARGGQRSKLRGEVLNPRQSTRRRGEAAALTYLASFSS